MGAWGAIIMGFFGAVFAAMTLYWQWHLPPEVLALPFIGFLLIASAAAHVIRQPGSGLVPSERVARVIMWSSIGEGIGLFLVTNVVINLQRTDLLLPMMALVVGLHFVPIGLAAAFAPFLVLGGALIVAAIAGCVTPAPTGGEISGIAAACGLWIASILAIRRDLLAKRASRAA